jgi:peroxiredoxin
MKWMLWCAALAAVASCGRGGRAPGDTEAFRPLDVGAPVPAYAALTLEGDTVRVGGASAGPPTVLNVWATWCTSCREEMSALDSLRREFKERGLRVVAVSVDGGNVERVRRFAASNHLGMVVAHDPEGSIERSFQVVGVPTTFVIDRAGKLVWRHTGNITDVLREAEAAAAGAVKGTANE